MTFEKYQLYCIEANKNRKNPEVENAINKQICLSDDARNKAKKRYEIEDKLYELYHSIPCDGIDEMLFGDEDMPENERFIRMAELWVKDDPRLKVIKDNMAKSGVQEEIGKLEQDYEKALFEYFIALIKLDTAIDESREKLFSQEYKDKLKEYADKGVLLYFLETPDAPILCDEISIDDTLESFSFAEYVSLKTLFYRFVTEDNPSPSMKRKIDDVYSVVNCLESGEYRSAARTVFALLESEHKNCSSAMDNFFTLNKKIRKGIERAELITLILNGIKQHNYFTMVWNTINPIYKGILDSNAESFIDRNSIIHGDYYSEKMDITEKDVIKLMLLFLNMRMVSDHIQLYCEMIKECTKYAEIHTAQQLKNKKK